MCKRCKYSTTLYFVWKKSWNEKDETSWFGGKGGRPSTTVGFQRHVNMIQAKQTPRRRVQWWGKLASPTKEQWDYANAMHAAEEKARKKRRRASRHPPTTPQKGPGRVALQSVPLPAIFMTFQGVPLPSQKTWENMIGRLEKKHGAGHRKGKTKKAVPQSKKINELAWPWWKWLVPFLTLRSRCVFIPNSLPSIYWWDLSLPANTKWLSDYKNDRVAFNEPQMTSLTPTS